MAQAAGSVMVVGKPCWLYPTVVISPPAAGAASEDEEPPCAGEEACGEEAGDEEGCEGGAVDCTRKIKVSGCFQGSEGTLGVAHAQVPRLAVRHGQSLLLSSQMAHRVSKFGQNLRESSSPPMAKRWG